MITVTKFMKCPSAEKHRCSGHCSHGDIHEEIDCCFEKCLEFDNAEPCVAVEAL